MALENFRTIELIWDRVNKSIIKTIKTASSDTTGRYLSVKILDGGQEVTLNNAKLQLYWEHPNFNTSGTDDFDIVNNGGLFKMTFSNKMLTNIGELNAHLILTLSDEKITSDGFPIEVIKGSSSGVVIPSSGESAAIKAVYDAMEKLNNFDSGPSIFMNTLSELQTTYPNGAAGVALVRETDPAKIYVWTGSAWEDFGNYQGIQIKDDSVTRTKLAKESVSEEKTTFMIKTDENISNNLFSGDYQIGALSSLAPYTLTNENVGSSRYTVVPVKPNKTYTVSKSNNTNYLRIGTFGSSPEIGYVPLRRIVATDIDETTFMTESNEHYLVVVPMATTDKNIPEWLIIEEGSEPTQSHELDERYLPSSQKKRNELAETNRMNLFDGTWYKGTLIGSRPYELTDDDTVNNVNISHMRYAVIKLESNSRYHISKSSDTNYLRAGLFESYPEIGQAPNDFFEFRNTLNASFRTGNKIKYAVIVAMASSDSKPPKNLFVTKDGNSTSKFTLNKEIMSNIFQDSPLNLFNNDYLPGTNTGNSPHVLTDDKNIIGQSQYTVVRVSPNKRYSISKSDDTNFLRVTSYTNYPSIGNSPNRMILGKDVNEDTVVTGSTDNYLVITPMSSSDAAPPTWLMVEQNGSSTEPFVLKENVKTKHSNRYMFTDMVSNFKKTTETYFSEADIGRNTSDRVGALYAKWDELVAYAPDYVTKEFLWNDASGELPVYRYKFKPDPPAVVARNNRFEATSDLNPFRVLAVALIHGHEWRVANQVLGFFSDLTKEWAGNEALTALRWNIEFDVIPIYSPWGYQNGTRGNSNGVDLNQNLTTDFIIQDEGSNYYSGLEALSEDENKNFDEYLDTLPYKYDFGIDFHSANDYTRSLYTVAFKTSDFEVRRMCAGVSQQMTGYVYNKFPDIFGTDNVNQTSIVAEIDDRARMYQFLSYKGIPSTIYETATSKNEFTPEVIDDISVTTIGNLCLAAIRNL